MEFRTSVRKLTPDATTEEIDVIFDEIDRDHSGDLEMNEIKICLKKLLDAYIKMSGGVAATQAAVDRLRRQAEQATRISELIAVYDKSVLEEEEALKRAVGANLGSLLRKKGLKAADLAAKWGGAKGGVDKDDFRKQVLALGIQAKNHEIDDLFKSLDADGGGTLDVEEITKALRTLTDEAENLKAEMNTFKTRKAEALANVKEAQDEWRRERNAEAAEEAAVLEQKRKEAEAKAAAAEEAKKAKAAAAAMKKAKAEEEKAAFEAKIAAKRAGRVDVQGQ